MGVPTAPATRELGKDLAEQRDRNPTLSATSWGPQDGMSFADWIEQGRKLGLMGRSAGWWIGDWLQYGNAVYGERYSRAARVTGYDVQTLMNMVYVASHVDPSRRRAKLSWSHHAEVVALEPAEQAVWLDFAERQGLSVRCLREAIRQERRALEARNGDRDATRLPRGRARNRGGDDHEPDDPQLVCPSCGHAFRTRAEPARK